MKDADSNTPKTLHIKSGKPVNMFEAAAWPAAFVQFFYGDCAPNLDRPQRVGVRELFYYLSTREELEYSLDSDKDDPLIPGGCYRAPAQSRWNTPEFMAVFADVVRKIRILQSTNTMWSSNTEKWAIDIKEICKAKVSDFEQLASILARSGQQSMSEMMRAAAEHKLLPLFKALQYLTFQTANIPLTQGYKTSLRQLGFGLNVYDGPLTVFLTTNFADMYSPITATLMNAAGEPLGKREVNLLQSVPCMPTLQAMHRALAKYPMLQVRLFLLLDDLVHTELLCMNAFIGVKKYGHRDAEPFREDDFATTGEIGIAHFPRSAMKPLEAQGRGFTHGHEKAISVPRTTAAKLKDRFTAAATEHRPLRSSISVPPSKAATLKELFTAHATEHRKDALSEWCTKAREEVLRAACTLQYDSAVLTGTQLGVMLRPEPFTTQQQKRTKFDGQVEEADDNKPLRPLIPVTEREPNGHLRLEEAKAVAEQRPMRHPYKELPLTSATQSLMPAYRLSCSFGAIEVPDEFGYYATDATERVASEGWLTTNKEYAVEPNGEVTGFCLPNGEVATPAQIQADCDAWSTSFARDQRGSFIQNHDHDCTGTCIKYQKKKQDATALPQRAGQKIGGSAVPQCRFRYFRYVALTIAGIIKYVIRRGKELVQHAYVATGNDENEYGKAVVERTSPTRSSSQDVLQATIRCNADYQYQKRTVPDVPATEQNADSADQYRFVHGLMCGCKELTHPQNKFILVTFATAMRAANVADFYMTKYLSKAQQALGDVMQPLIAGFRRTEAAESAPEAAQRTLVEQARRRILRLIFSANRTMWFSACELGVFLATDSSCVKTEPNIKVFSGKGMAMMHECKRLLNHGTGDKGLLFAARAPGRGGAASMEVFVVPRTIDDDAECDGKSDATEQTTAEDDDVASDAATEPADRGDDNADRCNQSRRALAPACATEPPKPHDNDADSTVAPQQSSATEQAMLEEDDDDPILPDAIVADDTQGITPTTKGKTILFTKSSSHRDDWLHRGASLQDMDYYHYSRYVERVEKPRRGNAAGFHKRRGVYHLFDSHYAMSRNYVQVLYRNPRTVQNVGSQCQRSDVNQGEDNAMYKAYFHSCIRCPGADECANPLLCQPLLQSSPEKQRTIGRFAPAWRTRRYEIEVLADRAAAKHKRAKRIGVIHDTTTYKGVRIPKQVPHANADVATERIFETRVLQIMIQQGVRRGMAHGTCLERVMQTIMEWLGVPLPWHPDQPHLAEWQAYSAREVLFNLDMSVDARNLAKEQAAKHKSSIVREANDDDAASYGPKLLIEDLGGPPVDDDVVEDLSGIKHQLRLPTARIMHVLARTAEREMAGKPGRPRDMHAEMQRVANVFGAELDDIGRPFQVHQQSNQTLGATIHLDLEHQKNVAAMLREQQEGEPMRTAEEEDTADADARLLEQEAQVLLQSMPVDLPDLGPVHVARYFVEKATLNGDQQQPVALIAKDMQAAWEKQGKPKQMKAVGKILRMLLLGGGGCGKTRIINLVLTALFFTFWGPRGCVKTAPSNKAARGILGKTLHTAGKLRGGSLKMMHLLCSQAVRSALAYLWGPCGALIIDEAPQGAAALYHAVALRSTYGRDIAHSLEVADYAEPSQSFGAMPVVVECGDELQLPPVPASSGLFAELNDVATEHMAGVQIFKQKDYVYRLSTMKRFTDDTQIAILTKMRQSGGCKLTDREWKALQNTDISKLSATEQRARLRGTELWYQAAPTWATVSMAQVIRSRLSAQQSGATLYIMAAEDHVLNHPQKSRLTDEYLAEQIASAPNMNNTARLPSIAMIHIGMEIRLTNTVEAPEVVTDSTGVVLGIDVDPEDARMAQHLPVGENQGVRILRKQPLAVMVKLHNVTTEFLPPIPCPLHAECGARRDCTTGCDFRAGCVAIEPQLGPRSFIVEVPDPDDPAFQFKLRIQRRQLPMTIKTASTLHTLQGVTASPGLIFHWKFPRLMSAELRWLATYVALSRPESLAQLISIGPLGNLRDTIESGPPDGILTRFNDMFQELELATHLRAAEVMQELGWNAAA